MPDQQRRGKPRFEPPPWEKDAFEELARKRAEADERERVTAASDAAAVWAAQAAAAAQAAEVAEAQEAPPAVEAPEPVAIPVAAEPLAEAARMIEEPALEAQPVGAPAAGETAALDERLVEAMLVQLKGEEPPVAPAVGRLGRVLAVAVAVIGAGMVVFSLVSLARTTGQPLGMIGSLVVGAFGMFLVGTGIWLWVRPHAAKGRL